jgi:hypothetical protein
MSRFPLREPTVYCIPPLGASKKILEVKVAGPGRLHTFLATRFHQTGDRAVADPSKMLSAEIALDRAQKSPHVILGGDLNICPPVPASEASGSLAGECSGQASEGAEYKVLTTSGRPWTVLRDAFRALPGSVHCSNGRGDLVLFRGEYKAVKYETCAFAEAGLPSDHPYILVTFEFTPSPPPPPPPACFSGSRCCGTISGNECIGQCVPNDRRCPLEP